MNPPNLLNDKVLSVSELNSLLKDVLEGTFPSIKIEGEISNYRPNSSGHLYFTLKDTTSQISAVMFRSNVMSLSFVPKDGVKVQCTGRITVYPPRGNYQILITKMEVAGEGDVLKMLEDRKRRLAMEGLFESQRKRQLPAFPKTIGVVTSSTGAALRDILQITRRRNPCVSVIIFPALVQGDEAAPSIVKQINTANAYNMCDVLIVGRGGGSLEDLLPFSEEIVVRAIAASKIPVVSAVGHEIDWALSDYAADCRAPTPSAAAEIVVPQKIDILNNLQYLSNELYQEMTRRIDKMKSMVKQFNPDNMELKFRSIEQPLLSRLDNAKEAIIQNMMQKVKDTKMLIENCHAILESSSPQTILARGYSMVRNKETQEIITNTKNLTKGTQIEIVPAVGRFTAVVDQIDS
ncbi:MAG: exodeoxyribonuclease VII large subunit [Treponema sp.]|jgi:exodeoxyribonuclease VII large subunit|nr:exodeoxyribonuclease VII large subunit [Treponema sp.]